MTVLDVESFKTRETWRALAACRDVDTAIFFPAGETGDALEQIEQAKALCRMCPVQQECLDYAISSNEQAGVWGGATETERRSIRRRRARQRRLQASSA